MCSVDNKRKHGSASKIKERVTHNCTKQTYESKTD